MPGVRHRLRGPAAAAVLLQQPLRRLRGVPRLRQHHRDRHGSRRARPGQEPQPACDRAVEQAALPHLPRRAEAGREAGRHPPRRALARPDGRRAAVRPRRRRRRVRGHPRVLPVAGAQEVQGARPRVPEPLPRIPDVPRVPGHAPAPRGEGRARRRPHDRRGVPAHREGGAALLRRAGALPEGRGGRRHAARGGPAQAVVPERRRPRLPHARPALVNALRRRVAAHQPGIGARIGAGRHALRPRRAVDRPASPRQPAPDRHPPAAARPGQHGARRRARRRHDPRRRSHRRPRAGRRRAGRAGDLQRRSRRPDARAAVAHRQVPARRAVDRRAVGPVPRRRPAHPGVSARPSTTCATSTWRSRSTR